MPGRRGAVAVIGIAGVAILAVAGVVLLLLPARFQAPRNVILISLDTLRADHLSLYGYSRPTSPRLDAFARGAFVFERALTAAPNTGPSHMSLMTSVYPVLHGLIGGLRRPSGGRRMLAEALSEAGLRSAAFVDGGQLSREFGFARGFDEYDDQGGGFARILPLAERWVQLNRDHRFFLFLHTYDIHTPYRPPKPFRGMFHDAPYTGSFVPDGKNMTALSLGRTEVSPEDRTHIVALYDEGIRYTDAELGGFLDFIDTRLGILDETVVVILSDHGEEFGEHGSYLHWQIYHQPNLHVPLVVRVPGASGARIATPVETIDVTPTLLDLLGLPALPGAEGRSLVPMMERAAAALPLPFASAESAPRPALAWPPVPTEIPTRSVIDGRYQLLVDVRTDSVRLFDLEDDPFATRDVAALHPEVAARLLAGWKRWYADNAGEIIQPGPEVELPEKTRRRLRELGYIE
jgi:arylsulfatase A-like enzyme